MEADLVTMLTSPVALLLMTVAGLVLFYKSTRRDVTNLPPGPRGWEALRCMATALRRGDLHIQGEEWSRRYGELVLCRCALGDFCFLNSARLVREVFAGKENEAYTNNRPATFAGWYVFDDYRDLAVSSPSWRPEWSKMRKMYHHAIKFYGDGVERIESIIRTELERLVTELEASNGQDVDMAHTFSNSLLCLVGALLTEEHVQPDSARSRAIKRMNDFVDDIFNFSNNIPLVAFPWLRFVPLLRYKQLCHDVIAARRDVMSYLFTPVKNAHVSGEPKGIVGVLLEEQRKGENQWLSDDHIKGLISNTIAGAYITSLQTLKSAFLCMAHYPEVMRRVQKEIDENIGDRPPCLEDKSNLPFTEAVVLETFRHTSFVPLGLAHETTDDVTVDNYTIPKGTMLFNNNWVFQRDPEVYPDPHRFQPDRFLDDSGQLLPATHPRRQNLLLFGTGKRTCPGKAFGRSRVFLYITTILQKFDILPPVNHSLLPEARSSWDNGVVLELQPYHVAVRARS